MVGNGGKMQLKRSIVLVVTLAVMVGAAVSSVWAKDYDSRFIRNYPPGYHGMWYNAERFLETAPVDKRFGESYRWDRFMSRVTGLTFPFLPIPYEWDYGTNRTFNLPDYAINDWW